MLKNYLTIALRNLRKHPGYTGINVFGLAVGIACCLLIMLFVRHELSYDRYHADADRLFRVTRSWFDEDGMTKLHLARVAAPVGPVLEQELPEVQMAARAWGNDFLLSYGDNHFPEEDFYFVEPAFVDLLTVRFLEGDPATALSEPYMLVLTESTARKIFGNAPAMGQTLLLDNDAEDPFTVTGIVADPPATTHFPYNALGSFATLVSAFPEGTWSNWGWNNYATYLRLAEGADPAAVEAKFPALLDAQYKVDASQETRLHLQPVPSIHLHSHLDAELAPNGDIRYVYLFSAIAFFLLLIACFNFVNLSTARATRRGREVGVRKVLGAYRKQLIRQFLGEAMLLTALALVVAIGFAQLALPAFNAYAGTSLTLLGGNTLFLVLCLVGILFMVGVAAGGYPAFYLSGFRPAAVLKGSVSGSWRSRFRSVLVVAQFAIAIVLLVGMGVVFQQLDYVQTKRLGFEQEQRIVLPTTGEIRQNLASVRQRLLAHPNIQSVGFSQRVPSHPLLDTIDGSAEVGGTMEPFQDLASVAVDPGFIETFGMTMAAGRNFSRERASDSTGAFVLNESAVRLLGWNSPEEAIGRTFVVDGESSGTQRGQVIGVVEDFHFESLHERITPLVLYNFPSYLWQMTVQVAGQDMPETLAFLEAQWASYFPNEPLNYAFVDEEFGALYEAEQRLGDILGIFAVLAILVACLGLFGLAAHTAAQRTKEIGIRKVLGASVPNLILLLTRHIILLAGVAFVIAVPISYFAMHRWLDGFAYRTDLGPGIFLLAGFLVLAIAMATVSYQALRATLADPVKSLRYE